MEEFKLEQIGTAEAAAAVKGWRDNIDTLSEPMRAAFAFASDMASHFKGLLIGGRPVPPTWTVTASAKISEEMPAFVYAVTLGAQHLAVAAIADATAGAAATLSLNMLRGFCVSVESSARRLLRRDFPAADWWRACDVVPLMTMPLCVWRDDSDRAAILADVEAWAAKRDAAENDDVRRR